MGSMGIREGKQALADEAASSGELIEGMPGVCDVKKLYWTYRGLSQLPGA